jgi:predicted acylesterase/phospholipase RssA
MSADPGKVALALAGGGPEGAIYEIGAIRALDEALDGIDFNDCCIYLGISAGAFIASCLANGLTTAQLCRAIVKHEPGEHPFVPETFFSPAIGEIVQRSLKIPKLVGEAVWSYITRLNLMGSVFHLSRALPVAIFRNEPIRKYLHEVFSIPGRTDDFRRLRRKLEVVATDLDSGRAVCFGAPGFDHIPISQAVQASTALPGLYPPVEIEGRHYVDGVLLKTVHVSVAFEEGAELVLCVNPIVPVDTIRTVEQGVMRRGKLIDLGLPTVLSQTLRTLVHSRIGMGLASFESRYGDRDVLVFEPPRDDYQMFFSNVFSFGKRKAVCEHAYNSTRRILLQDRSRLEPILARHGITLRTDILEEERNLWDSIGLGKRRRRRAPLTRRLDQALDQINLMLQESGQLTDSTPM